MLEAHFGLPGRLASLTCAVAALLAGGCLRAPELNSPTSESRRARAHPNAPESLTEEAVRAMNQLGAQVVRNEMGEVRSIVLSDLPIGDRSLDSLQHLPDLEVLSLSGTQVSDAGMTRLAELDRLSYLFMNNTQVTDQGLMALADSVSLRYISLDNTAVTSEAVEEFRQRSPGTVVQHSPRGLESEEEQTPPGRAPGKNGEILRDLAERSRSTPGEADFDTSIAPADDSRQKHSITLPPASGVRLRYRD